MTAASAAAAIPVSYFFRGLGSVFGFPNVASTLRFSSSHSLSMSSRDLDVIEARLSTRSTSIRIAYPRHIPMITPMLLSIYIHTTLPIPMPLSSSAAISLAAKFSFPGFIHGVVKPILPTPSTFCQANTPDPDLQLSPLNCYFRDGGAAAVIPCRYCFFRDLVGPDPSSAPLESVLYFPGRCGHAASASTATISELAAVIKLFFPGWRSWAPALEVI